MACPSPHLAAECRVVPLNERTSIIGAQTSLLIGREQSAHLLLLPLRVVCNCKEELIELITLRTVCSRDCRCVGREGVGRGGGARQNQRVGVLVVQLAEEEGARPQGFVRAERARLATGQERAVRAQGDRYDLSERRPAQPSARLGSARFVAARPSRLSALPASLAHPIRHSCARVAAPAVTASHLVLLLLLLCQRAIRVQRAATAAAAAAAAAASIGVSL